MYIHTKYIYIYTHTISIIISKHFQTFNVWRFFPQTFQLKFGEIFNQKNEILTGHPSKTWAELSSPTLSLQDRSTSQWYYTCRKRQGDSGPFFRSPLESVTSLSLVCLMMVVVVVFVVVFFLGGVEEDFDKKTKSYIVAFVGLWFCDLWFFVAVEYVWGGHWI